jgi:membrane associated rhomboid family serine protease
MFILLPFAHEKQTVQRLPYVTFALIALNIVFFLFTHFSGSSMDDFYEKLDAFQEYAASHPYLDIPPEGREYFEDWQLQQLDALREATNKQDLDPAQVEEDQKTLLSLMKEVRKVEKSNPYERWGYIPAEPSFFSLFTCMFIHGGWLHLIGNMFFLYLAGCSIEDIWGRPVYTSFYLLSGVAATMAHALQYPTDTAPLIGASGAIAGLMGAFLVRLYNTKISFFYLFGWWYRGTFKAPAYIMLPLWLAQQFFYAMLDQDGSSGVAFWAHIGGFGFGALFAFGMKRFQIEERFIAPKIEKKVGLAQHPDFLRAMNLTEQENYPDALILLHRVVRDDPNHLEAYLEMRRIAELNKDATSYNKFSTAIFDILLRTHDWDLLLDLYQQYQNSPFRQPLPAKSLLGLGTFFEETLDFRSAAQHYEEVTANYPQDPVSLRVHSKLARLYFEKIVDREKAIENFWRSYYHPHADSQWRAALQMDIKKYQIPEMPASAFQVTGAPVNPAPSPMPVAHAGFQELAQPASQPISPPLLPVDDSTQAIVVPPPVVPPRPAARLSSADRVVLPDGGFDGVVADSWHVVQCRLDRLALKGLDIRNEEQTPGLLAWKKIRTISVARLRVADPSQPASQRAFLVIDLIHDPATNGNSIVYRLKSEEIVFDKMFPGVDQSFDEAFQNFMGIVIKNSAARCLPNKDSCLGPNFATYPDLSRYELRLKEKLAH